MLFRVPATATSTIQPAATSSLAKTPLGLTTSPDGHVSTQPSPPMTTHWTRPLSCTWSYVVDDQSPSGTSGAVAWLDLDPIPGASTLSCYPGGMFVDGRTGVFSPATCPHGWTTVSLSVDTNEAPEVATTTALCCSSEYSLVDGHCKRQVPTVLAVPITYNHTAATYEVMTNSTTALYSATMAVNTIRALFREVDKALLGLTEESDIDDDPEPNGVLSLNAKIGIGVGVTIFGLLAIGAAIFSLLCRRERRRKKGPLSYELDAVDRGRADLHGDLSFGPRNRSLAHDPEPPPAYDIVTEANCRTDDESRHMATRDGEIRVLMAQKAAIQRRIEELESVETDGAPPRADNGP